MEASKAEFGCYLRLIGTLLFSRYKKWTGLAFVLFGLIASNVSLKKSEVVTVFIFFVADVFWPE